VKDKVLAQSTASTLARQQAFKGSAALRASICKNH